MDAGFSPPLMKISKLPETQMNDVLGATTIWVGENFRTFRDPRKPPLSPNSTVGNSVPKPVPLMTRLASALVNELLTSTPAYSMEQQNKIINSRNANLGGDHLRKSVVMVSNLRLPMSIRRLNLSTQEECETWEKRITI